MLPQCRHSLLIGCCTLLALYGVFANAESYCEATAAPEVDSLTNNTELFQSVPDIADDFAACFRDRVSSALIADNEPLAIVDVRTARQFATVHVEGALNVPLHLIPTRGFLRTTPLVLMGGDAELAGMLKLCTELRRERGQKVWVEAAGIGADWAKLRLVGNAPTSPALATISGNEFLKALPVLTWSILVVTNEELTDDFPPPVNVISRSQLRNDFSKQIGALLANSDRVLLVGDHVENSALDAHLPKMDLNQLRILRGGLDEFRKLISMQESLDNRRLASTAAPKTCAKQQKQEGQGGETRG